MNTDRPSSVEAFVKDSERVGLCAVLAELFRCSVKFDCKGRARRSLAELCYSLGAVKQVRQAASYLNKTGNGPADVVTFGRRTCGSAHEAAIELAQWYVNLVWIQMDVDNVPSTWEDPIEEGFDPFALLSEDRISEVWPNLQRVFGLEPEVDSSQITARIDKERADVITLLRDDGVPETDGPPDLRTFVKEYKATAGNEEATDTKVATACLEKYPSHPELVGKNQKQQRAAVKNRRHYDPRSQDNNGNPKSAK